MVLPCRVSNVDVVEHRRRKERVMSNKNSCDILAERFAKKAASGLRDVKFFLQNSDDAGAAEVCEEVNRLYDAMEDPSRVKPLKFNDLRWNDAAT